MRITPEQIVARLGALMDEANIPVTNAGDLLAMAIFRLIESERAACLGFTRTNKMSNGGLH